MNCIFCKIIAGEIPSDRVYEDDSAIVIRDIAPAAPVHLLAIPKAHYPSIHDVPTDEMAPVLGGVMNAVKKAVEICGLAEGGYRLAVNSGESACQTVPHIHVHVLGGRQMAWPPG